MVEGPAGGGGAVGDAELGVDVLDVVVGGLRRDEQLLGDLARRRPVRDQPEHLRLPRSQARRASPAAVARALRATSIRCTAYAAASGRSKAPPVAAYLVAASLPSLASSRLLSSGSVGTWWKLAGWLAIAASRVRAAPGWSSRSSSAGRLASVMTSWATAPERRNASIEVSKSDSARLQLPVDVCRSAASRDMKPSKNRTPCPATRRCPRPTPPAHAAGPPSRTPARRSTACRRSSTGCRARAPPRPPRRRVPSPRRPVRRTAGRRRTPRSRRHAPGRAAPRPRGSARGSGRGCRSRPPPAPR